MCREQTTQNLVLGLGESGVRAVSICVFLLRGAPTAHLLHAQPSDVISLIAEQEDL